LNKEPSISGGLSSALDAARWIAASMVVISHVHRLVMVNFPMVEKQTYLIKALYFFGSFGSEAVIVFFVISGYLVGGTTSKRWQEGQRDMWRYAAQRVSRIYTVLIPALIAGGSLDLLGKTIFGSQSLYGSESVINQMTAIDIAPLTFAGNLLMLEGIKVPVLGTNGPLWSLAYEWWYYCIFAAGLAFWFCSGARRWIAALVIIMGILLLPMKIWLWMIIWGLGVVAFHVEKSTLRKPPAWLGTLILLVVLVVCRFNHNHDRAVEEAVASQFIRDAFLGLAFAFSIVCWSNIERPITGTTVHAYLAGFSYSLYLIHVPIMVFLASALKQVGGFLYSRQPSLNAYLYVLLLFTSLYAFSWLFSRLTEENTGVFFNKIYRIGKSKAGDRVVPT
jgi:peptidoglycan/LPS O-acetylase OafA/YrhL